MAVLATRLGKIRGFVAHDNVDAFLGVRFGQPPTGKYRFKAAVMAEGWSGVYDATEYPNRAMQSKTLSTPGLPYF